MRLQTDELIAELEWFKAAGVSGALTVEMLARKWQAVERLCYRVGRPDLASWVAEGFHADQRKAAKRRRAA